jgi:hypothetical protein
MFDGAADPVITKKRILLLAVPRCPKILEIFRIDGA